MFTASDPQLKAAERVNAPLADVSPGALPVAPAPTNAPHAQPPVDLARAAEPRSRRKFAIYVALGVATLFYSLQLLASALATPLESASSAAAPTWQIEVTTMSAHATTALAWGEDVGYHLVRIPAGKGNVSGTKIIPAHLARGELHLMSLSLRPLSLQATAPPGSGTKFFSAVAPMIVATQSGVRIGW